MSSIKNIVSGFIRIIQHPGVDKTRKWIIALTGVGKLAHDCYKDYKKSVVQQKAKSELAKKKSA